ncbi:hypothetical protein [Halorussus ruber]|uniref:hypothetical protein n=1 Tax=Halorussus ruber TaxID=1126238 RepID=UPI0010925A49|nr:hypothetical protein [Halorussus ruber]
MSEKEFIEFIPGIISSTTEDRHGHEISKSTLEKWAKELRDEKKTIPFTFNHSSEPVGEWLDAQVLSHGDSAFLAGMVGIYSGNQDAVERLNDGEFGGLSIQGTTYRNITENQFTSADEVISLSVEPSWSESIGGIIDQQGAGYRFEIQKSEVGLALFEIVIGNIDGIIQALIMIHAYCTYQRKVFEEENQTEESSTRANIQLPDGTEVNLVENNAKEVIVQLEESGYEVQINPEEAEQLSDTYQKAIKEKDAEDD